MEEHLLTCPPLSALPWCPQAEGGTGLGGQVLGGGLGHPLGQQRGSQPWFHPRRVPGRVSQD